MLLAFGEVLFDIFPDYTRLGGAPFNFHYHLSRLKQRCALLSRIGEDANGRRILDFFDRNGLITDYIQVDPLRPTGTVKVDLDSASNPRFTIVKDVAYDNILLENNLLDADIELIYYGTLAQRSSNSANTWLKLLQRYGATATALYDINLRPGIGRAEVIDRSLSACDILKVNDEELLRLGGILSHDGPDRALIDYLHDAYDIEWICVTRGADGSELYTREGKYSAGVNMMDNIIDPVGAGDAFCAIIALGYLMGWAPQCVVERATGFASAVCTIAGAIPADDGFYAPFKSW